MNDYANFYRQIAEMEREAGRSNRRGRRSGAAWERTPEANRAPEVPRFSPEEVAQLERETAVERARQNARDAYSPLPDEFGPLVPMSAMAADLIQAPIDAAQASTGDAAAQRRLGARDERWRRGGERAGQDILAEGHGGQLMQFFSDLPGQMDEAEQARLEAGGRDTALDRVGSALGGFWTGMAAGPREARGEVAAQDEIRAQHRSDAAAAMERGDDVGARSAALSGRMAEREGDVSAGEDFWYNAPWAAEFIPGVGLLDVATSAGRFGARQGFRAAGQEIPEAIARPNRLSETQRVGPATENARGWRNNALLGGAAYLGADALDGELGDDYTAPALIAGGAMLAGRKAGLVRGIETAIPEEIQHLARQGELGPDGARNYTPNPRQRLTVDPEGRVAMDYEGSFNAGDGASVGEVRSLMRGAREALDDDIATTRRSEYSWTPNGESQARLYRNEFERNTPENYAFSETPQGEMRLRRLGAEFEPDTLPAERVIDWEADIVPERSAMRDLGIGSRATERFDIGDASFRVEFDPDVAADAAVVNFRRVGQGRGGDGVNEYAPTGEAGLSAGRVFEQVQAAIRRDIAQNQRQRYGFNGETAQQRALYQRMARTTEPPAGYRWSGPDSAGMVFLERNAPSAGARRLDRGDTSAAVATIGAGGALLFGDEAAAEEGDDPLAGLEINPDSSPPSMGSVVGAPAVYGDVYVQEFSDGSRHAFRMNRSGERADPEYLGEIVGSNIQSERVGDVYNYSYDNSLPSRPYEPPREEDQRRLGSVRPALAAGAGLATSLLVPGRYGNATRMAASGVATGVVDTAIGGDWTESLPLAAAVSGGGEFVRFGADDVARRLGTHGEDMALALDPAFRARRDAFAQSLPNNIPTARVSETRNYHGEIQRPDEGLFGGEPFVIPGDEMAAQGYSYNRPVENMPTQREQFLDAPPAVQREWMDHADPPALRSDPNADPERVAQGQAIQRRLGEPQAPAREQANPFIAPETGTSVFGEPRRPRAPRAPLPPLAERAESAGAQGAMRGVRVGPMREMADDLGVAAEGRTAGELRKAIVRELGRRFDSTREMVAFLARYGVTAAALGIGSEMLAPPEPEKQRRLS